MTTEITPNDLPQWKCHKVVRAAKIRGVNQENHLLFFEDNTVLKVELVYFVKHQPEPGGYLVVYDDGYLSFSPAKAFEEGYTKL